MAISIRIFLRGVPPPARHFSSAGPQRQAKLPAVLAFLKPRARYSMSLSQPGSVMHQPYLDRSRYVLGDASRHVGLLNCERIADRRHIHDWQVDAHFHEGLAQLFFFAAGEVQGRIDYEAQRIAAPALVWMPALVSHGFLYPAGMIGWVVTIPSADLARLAAALPQPAWLERAAVLTGADLAPDLPELRRTFEMLEAEFHGASEARDMAIEALFRLILLRLHRGLARRTAVVPATPDRRRGLVRRFEALVDRDPGANRPVGDYAAALNVTPTHLARTVRAVTGRAPADIVHDRLILAARRQIVFTDLPMAEIAYRLNFSSPSYFTRFFSRQTGEKPTAFRARMRRQAD
jgi:AraC family transcriptional activator of pobA